MAEQSGKPTAPPVIAPPPVRAKKSNALIILIVAVVLGIGFFVVIIGAAIFIPALLRARMTANESSAMTSLRAIAAAQVVYASSCGRGGYADSLTTLAVPEKEGQLPFLDQPFSANNAPTVSGYNFAMASGAGATAGQVDCHGKPTVTAFYATAVPTTYNTTGTRSFAVNSTNTLWSIIRETAPLEPFGPPAVIAR